MCEITFIFNGIVSRNVRGKAIGDVLNFSHENNKKIYMKTLHSGYISKVDQVLYLAAPLRLVHFRDVSLHTFKSLLHAYLLRLLCRRCTSEKTLWIHMRLHYCFSCCLPTRMQMHLSKRTLPDAIARCTVRMFTCLPTIYWTLDVSSIRFSHRIQRLRVH